MKKIFFLGMVSLLLTTTVFASDYVLPYPSYMPGNKLYKVSRLIDKLQNYWYWGNIAQEQYHLGLADKYLVEAKTLFEYNQYLLAADALNRSNQQFQLVRPYIVKAQKQGVDVKDILNIFSAAEEKHEEVLNILEKEVPETFVWTPEKDKPTNLPLHQLLEQAVVIRKNEIN